MPRSELPVDAIATVTRFILRMIQTFDLEDLRKGPQNQVFVVPHVDRAILVPQPFADTRVKFFGLFLAAAAKGWERLRDRFDRRVRLLKFADCSGGQRHGCKSRRISAVIKIGLQGLGGYQLKPADGVALFMN